MIFFNDGGIMGKQIGEPWTRNEKNMKRYKD